MNQKTIGLRLAKLHVAHIISAVMLLLMFMPYIKGTGLNIFKVITEIKTANGFYILHLIGASLVIINAILAIITFVKPGKVAGKIWMAVAAMQTVIYTIELFATKIIVDKAGILDNKFMVREFGFAFWFTLIFAYANLTFIMKGIRVNSGYIALVILSILWLFPILWIVLTAFRGEGGYYVGYFFPKELTLDNFKNMLSSGSIIPFRKWWINTFIVAVCTCILSTIIILATAYVLSRTRFEGRKTLMKFMLIVGMFPGFMSMIAVYNILKGLGLSQTLVALIVVSAAGSAMGYYICKGFFDTVPKSLDEAARIDGATKWQTFTRILIPLSKPVIIYTILTSFLGPWTDYIFPSMVLGDKQESYTVAVGLKWMTDFQRIDTYYTQFAAGALMVSIPIVILFIALQKFYVEGLSGSVKG